MASITRTLTAFERLSISSNQASSSSSTVSHQSYKAKLEGKEPTHSSSHALVARTATAAQPLFVIRNAHQDDIHGVIKISETRFFSGSKDGALTLWDAGSAELQSGTWALDSICGSDVYKPDEIDYRHWITGLVTHPQGWLSATRSGDVHLWTNDGKLNRQLLSAPPAAISSSTAKRPANCKERNIERIMCVAVGLTTAGAAPYIIGRRGGFDVYNFTNNQQINRCETHKQDWVYCINPLAMNKYLVVTGPSLDIWTNTAPTQWKKESLISESDAKLSKSESRPFIAAVTEIDEKPGVYGIAVFGGTIRKGAVRIFDINRKISVCNYQEHTGRVWQVENIRSNVIASCADDATIKLWDYRQPKSVVTISGHAGRVSSLLRLSPNTLVSGTCPDDIKRSAEKASFCFWDIRKL